MLAALYPAGPAEAAIVGEAVAQANYKGSRVLSNRVRQSVDVAPGVAALSLVSGPVSRRQVLPGLFELGHAVRARNTGTLTLDDVQIGEDLNTTLTRARILAGPWLDIDGIAGIGTNPLFDGRSDRLMLGAGARLAPGEEAEVALRLHAVGRPGAFTFAPRPRAIARQLPNPVEAAAPAEVLGKTDAGLLGPGEGDRAAMAIVYGPVAEPDGWLLVTYRLVVAARTEGIEGVSIRDDLAAGFGDGNFRIVSLDAVVVPERFGAGTNPYFDGTDDIDLLTSGGDLAPGERVAIDLTLRVRAGSGAGAGAGTRMHAMTVGQVNAPDPVARAAVTTAFPDLTTAMPVMVSVSADKERFGPGDRLGFLLRVEGKTGAGETGGAEAGRTEPADIVVRIAEGLSYLPGTGRVDGQSSEPVADADLLVWSSVVPAGNDTRIDFDLVADPSMGGKAFATTGFVRDIATGAMLSTPASVTVRRDEEAVYDCSGVTGEVFEDSNRDGFRQTGEPGIGGVRVGFRPGPRVTSRRDGSFDLACAVLDRARFGGEETLELVLPTLPSGYHPTTITTQTVSLRRGRVARVGFGAARLPVIAFRLDAAGFVEGGTQLRGEALQALARVINRLEQAPSVLRIVIREGENRELALRRMGAVRALAEKAWEADARPHELVIETRLE